MMDVCFNKESKMKKRTRILSMLLTAVLTIAMMSAGMCVFADETEPAPADGPAFSETVNPFTDLDKDAWYYDEVLYAYNHKIMIGMSEKSFAPNDGMTRAMFLTALGRMCGVNPNFYKGNHFKFDDVQPGQWYSPYIEWACSCGIAYGMTPKHFGTDVQINREMMSTFISRFFGWRGLNPKPVKDAVPQFKDYSKVSGWARADLNFMRSIGIVKGDENGYFNPQKNATRAESSAMLTRIYKKYARSF